MGEKHSIRHPANKHRDDDFNLGMEQDHFMQITHFVFRQLSVRDSNSNPFASIRPRLLFSFIIQTFSEVAPAILITIFPKMSPNTKKKKKKKKKKNHVISRDKQEIPFSFVFHFPSFSLES